MKADRIILLNDITGNRIEFDKSRNRYWVFTKNEGYISTRCPSLLAAEIKLKDARK